MATKNLIGSMPVNEKLDSSNYDIWHLQVQLILKEGDIQDHQTVSMRFPTDTDE